MWENPTKGSYIKIPIQINPETKTIYVLRINDNHFDLLIPIGETTNKTNENYNHFRKFHGKTVIKTQNNLHGNKLRKTKSTNTRKSTRKRINK